MARDHYIPQAYLKQFHCDKGSNIVYMLKKDRECEAYKTVHTRSICNIENGNRSDFLLDREALENFLKDLEPSLPNIIEKIKRQEIDFEVLDVLSSIISYIYNCAPTGRKIIKKSNTYALEKIVKKIPEINAPIEFIDKGKSLSELLDLGIIKINVDDAFALARAAENIWAFKEYLIKGDWTFLFSDSRVALITSDYPIISKFDEFGYSGEFLFPITPNIVVKIKIFRNMNFGKYRLLRISSKDIRKINRDIIRNTQKYIFSSNRSYEIIEMIRKNWNYGTYVVDKGTNDILLLKKGICQQKDG